MTSRAAALTWGELLTAVAMRSTQMLVVSEPEQEVRSVRLIARVEDVLTCRPGTVAVMHGQVARSGWAVEIAVRYAWERHLIGLIAQVDESARPPIERLARRLSVSVGFQDGDLADFALHLASQIAGPEVARDRLVRAAEEEVLRSSNADEVVAALNAELPEADVALLGPHGAVIAGCCPETSDQAVVREPLQPFDFQPGRELVATVSSRSGGQAHAVNHALKVARSHIIACEAAERVSLESRYRRERHALTGLIGGSQRADAEAQSLGWTFSQPVFAAVLVPSAAAAPTDESGFALRAAWASRDWPLEPVPHGEGWAVWRPVSHHVEHKEAPDQADGLKRFTAALRRKLARLDLGFGLCAGVGGVVTDPSELSDVLERALTAAHGARIDGAGSVLPFGGLRPRAFLAAVDAPGLILLARRLLSALDHVEDRYTLISTLAAYLDCGSSVSRAATRLQVHRNTVSGRLDRLRSYGLDFDDPEQALALHVASHAATIPSI